MTTEAPPAPASEPVQPATPPATEAITTNPPPASPPVVPPVESPPPSTPPPPPPIGPDGKLGENWFLSLGDEFAPHAKDLAKHKDLRSLITELQYHRKGGVEYPGEGAQPAAVDRFRAVAGVPETPEGYGLTAENMKLPEGMAFDAELATAIAAAAHKTHTPPAAVAAMAGVFNDILASRTAEAAKAAAASVAAAKDALVKEWRGDFQTNSSTVRHLTGKLAEQAGIMPDDASIPELANNPAFARMMLAVSKLTSEDRVHTPSGFGDLKSPAQRIAEITSGQDPVWGRKWTSGTREEKAEAYEYVKALREKAAQ